jgi:hypothetical protein
MRQGMFMIEEDVSSDVGNGDKKDLPATWQSCLAL